MYYHSLLRIRQSYGRRTELLRGHWLRFRGACISHHVGIGPRVCVEYPQCLSIDHDVTIMEGGFLHCLSEKGVHIGHNTSFHIGLWLHCGGSNERAGTGFFHIGDHSFVGPYGIMGAGGGIEIGNHVQMGPMVSIHAENHHFEDPDKRIDEQGVWHQGVIIEDDCWIGAKAIILDGVTIGRGSVIGAGAVVTRSVPPYSVAVGNPARVIKRRRESEV